MKITFKGETVKTHGEVPRINTKAPDFGFTKQNLTECFLTEFKDATTILNIFPSLDTPVCAASVRKFNEFAANLENTKVLCLSADLPFAQQRFCVAEGIDNVIAGSVFRHPELGKKYGLLLEDGPLRGLLTRAVIIVNGDMMVKYVQVVPEITHNPDYDAVMDALKKID